MKSKNIAKHSSKNSQFILEKKKKKSAMVPPSVHIHPLLLRAWLWVIELDQLAEQYQRRSHPL